MEKITLRTGWELFWLFAKIGVSTFGGGYAMLPLFQRELIERRGWLTEEELMDYVAIGQCTPGLIAINSSTFVGYKRYGVVGGVVSTAGMVFPSLVIISIIAACLQNFAHLPAVIHAFAGIRVCVTLLILQSVARLWKKSVIDKFTLAVFLIALVLALPLSFSPVVVVALAASAGVLLQVRRDRKA